MSAPLKVSDALGMGYCIVSRASRGAARIDHPDWRKIMAGKNPNGEQWIKNLGSRAADQYRRCYSKDWITVPQSWIKLLPNSINGPKEYLP